MPHVITQACCADASCVYACPVNCIHPTPDEADFATAEMLYIDPLSCVDCGACVSACPVGAIKRDTRLSPEEQPFLDINAAFYSPPREYPPQARLERALGNNSGQMHVAIVGSGPAAMYTADALLERPGVYVTVIERLPVPHGLVRHGVAPDHPETKTIQSLFAQIERDPRMRYLLGVDVGTDVSHDEVAAHFDAVVYATGASGERRLDIPGQELSHTATELVAWYNGHPDYTDRQFDLSGERAVIIGNGNVALDVARVLTGEPEDLARTDIADHALEALRASRIREVTVLARRGVGQSAFTLPEITGLISRHSAGVYADGAGLDDYTARLYQQDELDMAVRGKIDAVASLSRPPSDGREPRIVFRFCGSPVEIAATSSSSGEAAVEGVHIAANRLVRSDGHVRAQTTGETHWLPAGLVLTSVGYHGTPVPGLPFADGTIPNDAGRVESMPGVYVVGWIKRGPTGFIGTNKSCARETVESMMADANANRWARPAGSAADFENLVRRRGARVLHLDQWRRLDWLERQWGRASGRPRRKLTDRSQIYGLWNAPDSETNYDAAPPRSRLEVDQRPAIAEG